MTIRAAKISTQAAISVLSRSIAEGVALQAKMAELALKLSSIKNEIKTALVESDLERFATIYGQEAVLIEQATFSWSVDKLEKILDADDFEDLCPRKPDGAELRKRLESAERSPGDKFLKQLTSCAKRSTRVNLELRPAVAVESAQTTEQERSGV